MTALSILSAAALIAIIVCCATFIFAIMVIAGRVEDE